MSKGKIFLIIGLAILLLGVPAGILLLKQQTIFRLGAQDPNRPENVKVLETTEQTASISWTTKNPTQSLISYGLSPANLTLLQPETTPAVNHQANLVGLVAGSNYFFVIKTGNKTFDNNGQPYAFTTLARSVTPTSAPLTEEGWRAAIETNDPTYDLNKDGIVNTLDLSLLRQQTK